MALEFREVFLSQSSPRSPALCCCHVCQAPWCLVSQQHSCSSFFLSGISAEAARLPYLRASTFGQVPVPLLPARRPRGDQSQQVQLWVPEERLRHPTARSSDFPTEQPVSARCPSTTARAPLLGERSVFVVGKWPPRLPVKSKCSKDLEVCVSISTHSHFSSRCIQHCQATQKAKSVFCCYRETETWPIRPGRSWLFNPEEPLEKQRGMELL